MITKNAIFNRSLPKEYISCLKKKLPNVSFFEFDGIYVDTKKHVYKSILSHPDIYFFKINNNIVYAPGIKNEVIKKMKCLSSIEFIKGNDTPYGIYPNTALYNAICIDKFVVHNLNYTDFFIKKVSEKNNKSLIHVNQGYANCSSLVFENKKAVITTDVGIAKKLKTLYIDVLLLSSFEILLPGEKYGFIGGCSTVMDNGDVIFIGDINLHSQNKEIKCFFKKFGVKYIVLENLPLYDAGGIVFF